MIELINLHKSFAHTLALANINLFIQEGEIFGIIGKSGAGKSTLLRCINLLERPDHGEVIIDNANILTLPPQKLRSVQHKMAMIFQGFNLLSARTVYENIALPMRIQKIAAPIMHSKIIELLEFVDLREKQFAYPNQLSGGQKQRVAIARALSCAPKILLCDEATSALDPTTTNAILTLLKKINKLYGLTIVLITHEMEVIKKICHRLAVLEAGKLIQTTSLVNVLQQTGPAREMLYKHLSPHLPDCLQNSLTAIPNEHPLLRLFFEGHSANVPFISHVSRELNLDVNILLANVDHFDTITCGILVISVIAEAKLLALFIQKCKTANISVEILGYMINDPL